VSEDNKTGEIFTRYYAASDVPLLNDSARFRNRLSGLIEHYWREMGSPADFVKREVGIEFPGKYYPEGWDKFVKSGALEDIFDIITALFRLAQRSTEYSKFQPHAWRQNVQRIFNEERLSYFVDEKCGVRLRVDEAYEAERRSSISALTGPRYGATRAAFEAGLAAFDQSPPDTRAAIRGTFDAAETLFKLMFSVSRLGASEVDGELVRAIDSLYTGASRNFARMQAKSFREWVNAAHMFRHA
jgi:hypothetical protein